MKKEKSEKSKKEVAGFRTGDDVIERSAPYKLSHIEFRVLWA
jgi:hypothetical protein